MRLLATLSLLTTLSSASAVTDELWYPQHAAQSLKVVFDLPKLQREILIESGTIQTMVWQAQRTEITVQHAESHLSIDGVLATTWERPANSHCAWHSAGTNDLHVDSIKEEDLICTHVTPLSELKVSLADALRFDELGSSLAFEGPSDLRAFDAEEALTAITSTIVNKVAAMTTSFGRIDFDTQETWSDVEWGLGDEGEVFSALLKEHPVVEEWFLYDMIPSEVLSADFECSGSYSYSGHWDPFDEDAFEATLIYEMHYFFELDNEPCHVTVYYDAWNTSVRL